MKTNFGKMFRPVSYFLFAAGACLLFSQIFGSTAKADIATWTDSNGTSVDVADTVWSERIEFISPVQIKDKVTGTIYAMDDGIYDGQSQSYLRNGSGTYSNSNYLYVAMQSDYVTPLFLQSGRCFGIFSWHLHGNGLKSDLHVIQPEPTPDGTGCQVLQNDGESSYTRVALGAKSDLADSMNTRIVRLGEESNTPDDWTGDLSHVRMAVAPLYWRNNQQIGAFDSDIIFTRATGAALAGLQEKWKGDLGGYVPLESERQDLSQWSLWTTTSTDDQCGNIWFATRNNSPGYIYVMDDSSERNIDDNTVAGCIWNREMEGDSGDLINAENPTPIAFPQNALLGEEEVDERMFGATNNNDDSVTPDAPSEEEVVERATCGTEAKTALAWVLCPILDFADNTTEELGRAIQDFLFISPEQFSTNSDLYKSWNVLRQISTVIIVIVALIMIFSEAMGAGIMDNYSVKKLLPRLVLAGIGVQLSWVMTTALIEVTNVIGNGIGGILMAPFGLSLTSDLKEVIATSPAGGDIFGGDGGVGDAAGTQVLLFGALVLGGIAVFGALFALALGALAAVFVGFITLVVRNIIIYLGIVLSPIGIAMSVLPGTQKTSKFWWESFEKALLMYPIIMGLLAIGRVASKLILSGGEGGFEVIAGIVAWYAPFFFLPAALKAGGSALGKISGLAGDKSKGMFDRARGWDDNRKKRIKDVKTQSALSSGGIRGGIANFKAGNVGGLRRNTRQAFQLDRDKNIGEAKGKQAELDAAKAYRARTEGASLAIDQAEVKVAQTQAQQRLFDKKQAELDIQNQENKAATSRAVLSLQNQNGKSAIEMPDGSTVNFPGGFNFNSADDMAQLARSSKDRPTINAAIEQIVKTGSGAQFRTLLNDSKDPLKNISADTRAALVQATIDPGFYGQFKDSHTDLARGGAIQGFKDGFSAESIMSSKQDTIKAATNHYMEAVDAFNKQAAGGTLNDQETAIVAGYGSRAKLDSAIATTAASVRTAATNQTLRGSFKQPQATQALDLLTKLNGYGGTIIDPANLADVVTNIDPTTGIR